ncbi:hypothetical protein [Mesoaciditoga lauensis]|uniref:hypothetical protein n=1 Tax=Mesoaciditoga lauensis TaxID=1495039 RepID=UPI000560723E|nr:hypothetical protein [Mesoaciditoga lauensis]
MNMLDGFGNIFGVMKRKPSVIIPSLFGIGTLLVFNLVIFEYAANVRILSSTWIPFAFNVLKWAVIFSISAWTALLISREEVDSEKAFSKSFSNLFVFSTFMSFFVVSGFEMYVIPGIFILFFMLYIPTYAVLNEDTDALRGFKGNMNFILEDAHVIHTLVSLIIITLLILIPYAGEYLAAFFYMLWIPNIYISEKQEEKEESEE